MCAAEYSATSTELYEAYRTWTATNADERKMLSLTAWGRAMSAKGFEKFRKRPDGATEGNSLRYRSGLKLNPEWSRLR